MENFHYFATFALGWATAPTREEAIEKLVAANRNELKPIVKNTQKDGLPGAYIWTCKVHAPADANYKIEWYQPKGVETSDHQEHAVTYLTNTQIAHCRTYEGESKALREQLEDRTQLLRNLSYSVVTAESIHDSNVQKYAQEAKEFAVPNA